MASHSQHTEESHTTFHSKAVSHRLKLSNPATLTGNPDADDISQTWSIYVSIHSFTREPKVYESLPAAKLKRCRVDGAGFLWGIPCDDLLRGLLWHAVYKPFWNEGARHSRLAPSWTWVALRQRVGWPDYSSGRVSGGTVHVEDVAVEELQAGGMGTATPRHSTAVKSAGLFLAGEVFTATFKLHGDTKRKGSLTGPALEKTLACTMDCDFTERDVYVLKILTRELQGASFCSHFLVLEAVMPGEEQDIPDAETAESLGMKMTQSKLYRRIGTAKLNHQARGSCELRRDSGQRVNIVIV